MELGQVEVVVLKITELKIGNKTPKVTEVRDAKQTFCLEFLFILKIALCSNPLKITVCVITSSSIKTHLSADQIRPHTNDFVSRLRLIKLSSKL